MFETPARSWRTRARAARRVAVRAATRVTRQSRIGCVFERDGKTWCVEELAAGGDDGDAAGLYAYDTTRWASATLRLDERCKFFGRDVLEQLEHAHRANSRATADV